MIRRILTLAAATGVAAVLSLGAAAAPGDRVVATATGGGIAAFTPPWSPDYPITYFGLGATLRADGGARGRFECGIPNLLTLNGSIESGQLNADGSVTLRGKFDEIDYNASFFGDDAPIHWTGMPFTLQAWPGGAGVGRFVFTHPLGTDFETVVSGGIHIR